MSNSFQQRIQDLRQAMSAKDVQGYIIPTADPHQSEYVAEHFQARVWATGFTGSAGYLALDGTEAGVWTDSRYFIQGEKELAGSGIALQKQRIQAAPEHVEWLATRLNEGDVVACDGRLFSVVQVRQMEAILEKKGIALRTDVDLLPQVWKDRPALPMIPVYEHEVMYTGASRKEKLQQLRNTMTEQAVDYCLLTGLDDIAWLLNLRGSDVDFNPVFYSVILVGLQTATLFIAEEKVPTAIEKAMRKDQIFLARYDAVEFHLHHLKADERLLTDFGDINYNLYQAIPAGVLVKGSNPVRQMKGIKNATELAHFRSVHIKDGAALVKMHRWLQQTLQERAVSEAEIADQIAHFRGQQALYKGESFSAIVGWKGNGAIVHYHGTHDDCSTIPRQATGMLLIDCGGQYLDGTTDITRTICFGIPTEKEKQYNTLVLKGHIALASAKFPKGTKGIQLDTMARQPLWSHQLNYFHGTGHGIGFFLNVHEGPQGLSYVPQGRGVVPMEPGMVTTNEPGVYVEGEFGIRIENILVCHVLEDIGFGDFLGFETITYFPIQTNLIDIEMLTQQEKGWLNAYHALVVEQLSPALDAEETQWLLDACSPL